MIIAGKPWIKPYPPKKILVIRWQAMGDVIITLPYLQYLRKSLPEGTRIDFLTRKETEDIPRELELFDRVFSFGGKRNFKKQIFYLAMQVPRLLFRRYDVVLDLQHNILSTTLVWLLHPKAWSRFDRYSPAPAGERYRATIEAAGLGRMKTAYSLQLKNRQKADPILHRVGWTPSEKLIVLNPAGAFETRNWPLEYYSRFAKLWLELEPNSRFIVLGTTAITHKARYLKQELGDRLFYLVDQTTPSEAFSVLQRASLVLSEDSGLMHMAWTGGTPTLALFGGSRSDWSRPLGPHSLLLGSEDLPCGNCMQEKCIHGDVHCLTRRTPEQVVLKAWCLYKKFATT